MVRRKFGDQPSYVCDCNMVKSIDLCSTEGLRPVSRYLLRHRASAFRANGFTGQCPCHRSLKLCKLAIGGVSCPVHQWRNHRSQRAPASAGDAPFSTTHCRRKPFQNASGGALCSGLFHTIAWHGTHAIYRRSVIPFWSTAGCFHDKSSVKVLVSSRRIGDVPPLPLPAF